MDKSIKELASIIGSSKNTVVMTGAGMDTESNIPYVTKGKTVHINMEDTRGYDFDLKIIRKTKEILV